MATRSIPPSFHGVTNNPKTLGWVVAELINDIVASLNEMRTDHLGTGTSYQVLLTELVADHATTKTAVDETKTAVDELIDDHATSKTAVDGIETLIEEMYDDEEAKRNYLDYLWEADGVISGNYAFATAAATTIAVSGGIKWRRGGIARYDDTLPATLTLAIPTTTTIATTKFGAWRVVISDLGAITTQAANASTMQFANAEDALLNLAAIAPTASTVTIGYLLLENTSGGNFTVGTSNTNGAGFGWTFYYELGSRKQITGLTAALGASVAADTGAATWSSGTIDFQRNGLGLAQIAAIANQAMDDADTIADTEAGGWLLVTNLAGTGVYALASDGIAGSVSALANTDAAGALTALGLLTDRLPSLFCPIGRIIVVNASGAGFTAGTTNWDAAGITTTVANCTVGTWSRTATTGFDSHKINPPTIPAVLTAAKPSSGPATLTASKPTAGPATLTASVPAAHSSAAVDDISLTPGGAP